jgi:hypothetical protein
MAQTILLSQLLYSMQAFLQQQLLPAFVSFCTYMCHTNHSKPPPACSHLLPAHPGIEIPGLNDSKQLKEAEREALYEVITTTPGVLWAV